MSDANSRRRREACQRADRERRFARRRISKGFFAVFAIDVDGRRDRQSQFNSATRGGQQKAAFVANFKFNL